MNTMNKSGLIVSNNCKVYHLGFGKEMLAPLVFTVGDPDRIDLFKPYFSKLESECISREIRAIKGLINGKEVLVLSTGMGTDNIDIIINELELLANWDLERQEALREKTKLKIVRLGTSGALSEQFQIDDIVYSSHAFAFDNQHIWYPLADDKKYESFNKTAFSLAGMPTALVEASDELCAAFSSTFKPSLTYTANGFYAAQGRCLDQGTSQTYFDAIAQLSLDQIPVGNIEMETAGIYRLAKYFGHEALSVSALLAQRKKGGFSKNPTETLNAALSKIIEVLC